METFQLDNVSVLPQCKDMTPEKLFALFERDMAKMSDTLVKHNIPLSAIKNPNYYPQIATILHNKYAINCK
jgi:hypothetical protein